MSKLVEFRQSLAAEDGCTLADTLDVQGATSVVPPGRSRVWHNASNGAVRNFPNVALVEAFRLAMGLVPPAWHVPTCLLHVA